MEQTQAQPINAPRPIITLKTISFALVALGIAVSSYLSYVKFTAEPMICVGGAAFDCGLVQNSSYSLLLGIPIAYLGLATYLVIGGLLLAEGRIAALRDYGPMLLFGVVLFAFIYSMFLVYVQVAILQALCQWCLTHEVIMTILFGVTSIRFWRFMQAVE